MKTQRLMLVVALFALAAAPYAHAGPISVTVGGYGPAQFPGPVTPPSNAPWGPDGYPGDTVELQGNTFTLDLDALAGGPAVTRKVNTLLWMIDYTYAGTATDPDAWSDLQFNFTALRSISLDGTAGSLSQGGTLDVTWDNDFLTLAAGPAVSFIVQGYQVVVTPLGLARQGGTNFAGLPGGNPWAQPSRDVMATFQVTAVPDSGAMLALLGSALVGLGALSRKLRW